MVRLIVLGVLIAWVLGAALAAPLLGMSRGAAVMLGVILVVSGPTVVGPLLAFVRPMPCRVRGILTARFLWPTDRPGLTFPHSSLADRRPIGCPFSSCCYVLKRNSGIARKRTPATASKLLLCACDSGLRPQKGAIHPRRLAREQTAAWRCLGYGRAGLMSAVLPISLRLTRCRATSWKRSSRP